MQPGLQRPSTGGLGVCRSDGNRDRNLIEAAVAIAIAPTTGRSAGWIISLSRDEGMYSLWQRVGIRVTSLDGVASP